MLNRLKSNIPAKSKPHHKSFFIPIFGLPEHETIVRHSERSDIIGPHECICMYRWKWVKGTKCGMNAKHGIRRHKISLNAGTDVICAAVKTGVNNSLHTSVKV